MVGIYRRQRLRGTVALQASIDHCCQERMAIAGRAPGGRPLRRRREMVGIYRRQRLRGIVALQASFDYRCRDRMAIAGRAPGAGGRPLRRRRGTGVQFAAGRGCEGPQPSRQPPIIVARNRWVIAGRFPGRRPLRRRRDMVLIYGRQRLRGTVALQASIDHCCQEQRPLPADPLEGARSAP